jgi:hypothetical protein
MHAPPCDAGRGVAQELDGLAMPEQTDNIYRVSAGGKSAKNLTKSQWQALGRKVRKGEKPIAVRPYKVYEPRPVYALQPNGERLETTQRVEVVKEAKLYSNEQTQPYKGSQRTGAYLWFYELFCRDSSKERHIRWMGGEMDGDPGWKNRSGQLTMSEVQAHINMTANRQTGVVTKLGVVGGERTRFLLIDLDLHGGDRGVFMAHAEMLINTFYGRDGWHAIVADRDANGIHLVRAFRDPVRTSAAILNLRQSLAELDMARPDLTDMALAHGMKPLGEAEIYPNSGNGVRLPLCEGRAVLIDRPLALVKNRYGRLVQDVEGYIGWILDKNRQYMDKGKVLAYLRNRLKPASGLSIAIPSSKKTISAPKTPPAPKLSRRGRQAQIVHAFWDGAGEIVITLNQAIIDMARIMAHHPEFHGGEEAAVELLAEMVRDLPNYSVSQRLDDGNWGAITKVIRESAAIAFSGNEGQADSASSTAKLQAACDHWAKKGYLPWDKASRLKFASFADGVEDRELIFRQEHLEFIHNQIRLVLKTDKDIAVRFMNHFLNFVFRHPGEISTRVLLKKMLNDFGIPAGTDKLTGFMRLLVASEWIYIRTPEQWHVGRKGRARSYGLGQATVTLFKEANKTTPINTNTPSPPASIIMT